MDTQTDHQPNQPFYHRRAVQIAAGAALLVVVAYILGRYATGQHLSSGWHLIASATAAISFGALLGIPIGLFYGSLKSQAPGPIAQHYHPSYLKQQDKILEQIKDELSRDRSLLKTRVGDSVSTTGVRYDTTFWSAVKASGQLFVMQEPKLLGTLAKAYYWLDEANRLESLAFQSHFAPTVVIDNQNATTHLLAQVRLLDGVVGSSLDYAIISIDAQLGIDRAMPPTAAEPKPVA